MKCPSCPPTKWPLGCQAVSREGISCFLPVLHLELSAHSDKWSVIPHIVCELLIAASCRVIGVKDTVAAIYKVPFIDLVLCLHVHVEQEIRIDGKAPKFGFKGRGPLFSGSPQDAPTNKGVNPVCGLVGREGLGPPPEGAAYLKVHHCAEIGVAGAGKHRDGQFRHVRDQATRGIDVIGQRRFAHRIDARNVYTTPDRESGWIKNGNLYVSLTRYAFVRFHIEPINEKSPWSLANLEVSTEYKHESIK